MGRGWTDVGRRLTDVTLGGFCFSLGGGLGGSRGGGLGGDRMPPRLGPGGRVYTFISLGGSGGALGSLW